MEMILQELSPLLGGALTAALLLTGTTNIIVEVLKALLGKRVPWNLLAVLVSMAVTLTAFGACCSAMDLQVRWYMAAGAVALGLFVAYGAMFGYDKLREALEKLGKR